MDRTDECFMAGQVECVKVLLDRDAEVNMQDKVIGVIIHCVHAMQHVPRVPPHYWRMYMNVLIDFVPSLKTSLKLTAKN